MRRSLALSLFLTHNLVRGMTTDGKEVSRELPRTDYRARAFTLLSHCKNWAHGYVQLINVTDRWTNKLVKLIKRLLWAEEKKKSKHCRNRNENG